MLLQQISQARAARGLAGAVVLHRLGFLVDLLSLDRQRDRAALAVHVRELRLDLVADLENRARVLDAVTRQLGSAQMAFDAAAQVDDRALGVDLADRTLHDRVLRVLGDPGRERVLRELLDAQRNALALRIDRQHHRFDLLALLVVAHGFLAGHVPRDVRQVHQAVDAARQADEDAEVGDRLDLARDLVAAVVVVAELLPRIRLALLDAQRNTPALFVDVEHHHLDFLADVHDLRGVHVLVGPVHLGHVHQAFDAFLDLDEAAVVGDIRHLAEQARAGRIAAADLLPRVVAELLDAQRHALALAIELQDAHVDLVADVDDFRRMLDALPRHVGGVQQAVGAAEVCGRAGVGEVLDRALDDRAFLPLLEQLGALGAVFLLDDRAARHHHVVALLVELDDLELERLAFEVRRIAHRAHVDERAGQERPHEIDLDGEAAFDAAVDDALDDLLLLESLLQARPGAGTLGLLARQARLAVAVLDAVECDFDVVADGDFELTALVLELIGWDDGFALQTRIDEHDVGSDFHDASGQDRAGLDLLGGQAFFEKLRKTLGHEYFRDPLGPRLSLTVVLTGEGLLHRTARPARRPILQTNRNLVL